MLADSKSALAAASAAERELAEIIALRALASEFEEDLIPPQDAVGMAQAHKDAGDETWMRAVYGILLGLRAANERGHRFQT